MIFIRIVGRNVVRMRLNSLLCITNYKREEISVFTNILSSSIDLHSNQVSGLSPDLCVPDVELSEVKRSLVLEHIWHQGHKILTTLIIKIK